MATVPPGLDNQARVEALWRTTREAKEPLMLAEWARSRMREGALFAFGHSGGKDSMVQLALAMRHLQIPRRQVLVIHADLHEMEWPGTVDAARAHAEHLGLPFMLVQSYDDVGRRWDWFRKVDAREMTLRENAERLAEEAEAARAKGRILGKDGAIELEARARSTAAASPYPSAGQRYCTSDLKTGPIFREVANYAQLHGFKEAINCIGLRGDESDRREGRATVRLEESAHGVDLYSWLPVQHLETDAPNAPRPMGVFGKLSEEMRLDPTTPRWHWAYDAGSERLSCMFCIYLSRPADLTLAALHAPELYARYVAHEAKTGHSSLMKRQFIQDVVGLSPKEVSARRVRLPVLAAQGHSKPEDPTSTADAVARTLGNGSKGRLALVARPKTTRHAADFVVVGGELRLRFGEGAFSPLAGAWCDWSVAERFAREKLGGHLTVASALPDTRLGERFAVEPKTGGGFTIRDTRTGAEYPAHFGPGGEANARATAEHLNAASKRPA